MTGVAYEQSLIRRRRGTYTSLSYIELLYGDEEEVAYKVLKRRRVAPPWWKPRTKKLYGKPKSYTTKSKNVRDLDQRKLRRKCINY